MATLPNTIAQARMYVGGHNNLHVMYTMRVTDFSVDQPHRVHLKEGPEAVYRMGRGGVQAADPRRVPNRRADG